VVALSPSKSHYYVLFIYHVKNIGQVSPNWPIFRNRDIVYIVVVAGPLNLLFGWMLYVVSWWAVLLVSSRFVIAAGICISASFSGRSVTLAGLVS